jgi:heptosyltransferase-2
MKVLVIQTAFLGDAIISLSLAEELRRLSPSAFIAYLVRPEAVPIIKLSPSVNKVIAFDKYNTESGISGIKNKAAELNSENFDIVFTLHSSKRTRILLKELQIPKKVGYGNYPELTNNLQEIDEPHTARAVRLLTPIFPEANLSALQSLKPDKNSLPLQVKALSSPIIAIASDSVWKTKQWGSKKFLELISLLDSKKYSIILIGSNNSNALRAAVNLLNNNALDLISKTSLEELVSVIEHCDLLISNDSAPVHIATATHTPCLAIFGPTVPDFGFAPPEARGEVVQIEDLWCRPCTSHGGNECPIHTHECMRDIMPQQVFDLALRMLDKHTGA